MFVMGDEVRRSQRRNNDEPNIRFEHNEEQSPLQSLPSICSPNLTWYTIRTQVWQRSRFMMF
jgi:hypothetical protein